MLNIKNLYPLPDFSWLDSSQRDIDKEYFAYYGIDFSAQYGEKLNHYFGVKSFSGYTIAVHYFSLSNATGTVVLNHGYMDHVGLYGHLIEVLLAAGYSVLTYDLPGHGLSSGEQAGIPDFADYQKVLSGLLEDAKEHLPKPLVLMGQSTGGSIAMDYVMNNPSHPFVKMVLFAPLVIPKRWSYIRFQLFLIGHIVKKVPREFVKNSSDKTFISFLKNADPLQTRSIKVSWVRALFHWQKHFAQCQSAEIPTLYIQGENDITVEWQYNMPRILEKFPHTKVVRLENANHHLVNEAEHFRKRMFKELEMFLAN